MLTPLIVLALACAPPESSDLDTATSAASTPAPPDVPARVLATSTVFVAPGEPAEVWFAVHSDDQLVEIRLESTAVPQKVGMLSGQDDCCVVETVPDWETCFTDAVNHDFVQLGDAWSYTLVVFDHSGEGDGGEVTVVVSEAEDADVGACGRFVCACG
ncbi:MAG: hypothetical protein ACI8PZ_002419 [Myxococcota bacterium]|jgi:hypothetical protein